MKAVANAGKPMDPVARNVLSIRERIAKAAERCGRSPDEITLLAVSKTFPAEFLVRAAEAGIRCFGENRVQEAETKIPQLRNIDGLQWHLIGHLQTNKARRAAELFDVIHSVDSVKLAAKLNQASTEAGKILSVLLQIDLGDEETKFGAEPRQIHELVEAINGFPGLRLNGLMTIPPFWDNPEDVRPYFARLRQLRDKMEMEQPGCLGLNHLSMGMSHDFEQAVQEGATILRIGTAIFGARE
jgi:pyridoxal phosphate enzyme (YggS family)